MSVDPIEIFISIAVIQTLGWLTPGPNLVAISGASMASGRKVGVATAAGVAMGVGLWALFAVFGVALLFEAFPSIFIALKLAGAAFLAWLGFQSIKASLKGVRGTLSASVERQDALPALRTGFLVLMTNPKAPIFFGAVLTSYLPLGAPNWIMGGIVIEFLVLSFILNSITALVFSTRQVMGWFEQNQVTIRFVFGLIYIGLALLVLRDAIA